MDKLNLYTVFHGNLQFSSIPKSDYKTVINNCYWPLLEILQNIDGLKLGIEFSALSLLEIKRLDKALIEKIRTLAKQRKLEFLGSSYSQTVFPLIPYEVNLKNLKLGIETYRKILGQVPKIFYVNEQTFSDGIIGVFKDAGVKNIMVDFDNTPEDVRLKKSLLYKRVKIASQSGEYLNVIWSSSIAFQKFQRYIFDEISYDDYWHYFLSNFLNKGQRNFCLYAGDWEVFGYSPKRINRNFDSDLARIKVLFEKLLGNAGIKFILPSELLEQNLQENSIRINDSQTPIGSKKQEKYNISRWSLAGKNTIFRNTACFRLYEAVRVLKQSKKVSASIISDLEENLMKLWGSDFRTNTTPDKNREYEHILKKSWVIVKKYSKSAPETDKNQHRFFPNGNLRNIRVQFSPVTEESFETPNVKLTLDKRRGGSVKELIFPNITSKKMAGLVPHGYFQSPRLSADWFTGHCLFEAEDGKKYTDLNNVQIFLRKKNDKRFIEVYCEVETPICDIKKICRIYKNSPRLDLEYLFNFKLMGLRSARVGNFTLDPCCFDKESFWYGTVNGGKNPELYKVDQTPIIQDEMLSFRISSKGSLGATEGWIAVGDKHKGLALLWNKAQIASSPIVHFEQTLQGLYGRIQPSIAESDETGYPIFEGPFAFSLTCVALESPFNLKNLNNFPRDNATI